MEADSSFHVSHSRSSTQFSSHHHSTPSTHKTSRPCHQISPKPHHTLFLLLFLSSCISIASAGKIYLADQMVEVSREEIAFQHSEDLGSAFHRLARTGTILVDQRPPPGPADWVPATFFESDLQRLQRRDDPLGSGDQGENTSSSSSSSSPTSTVKASSTASSSTTSSTTAATTSALPTPFDVGFSGNITTECASFMNNMLSNSTFKTCLPFSLLLQVRSFSNPSPCTCAILSHIESNPS